MPNFNFLFQNYLTRGFWGDESWTALISQLPILDIIKTTANDFHPPFYYLIVNLWGRVFGFGELAIRSISILAFLLTSIIIYFLAQILFKNKFKSLILSLLILISPILFTYALEARAYAFLTLLSVASAYVFLQAKNTNKILYKFLYLVLGIISIYTHYYAWFILFSHGFYLLLFERQKIKNLIWPAVGIVLAQLPWLPAFISQIDSVNNSYWIGAMNSKTHFEFFLRVCGGDMQTVYQFPVALFIFISIILSLLLRIKFKKLNKNYLFLLIWLIVPTLIPSLISLKIPIFFYRYLIFSIIPILFLSLDGLSFLNKKFANIFILILISFYLLIIQIKFLDYPRSMREVVNDWRVGAENFQPLPIYTPLGKFAELQYYLGNQKEIIVTKESLVHFSGQSLLETYLDKGWAKIAEPEGEYWYFDEGLNYEKKN